MAPTTGLISMIPPAMTSTMLGATRAGCTENGFDNRSDNFDRVYAYSTGGNDTAVFYDTEGSDYFKVDGHGARLYGDGYYNRAIQFRSHYTYFTAGDGVDQVWFGDSAEDDTILARRNMFMAWRNGAYFRVYNPDHVEAHASVGRDVARLYSNFEFYPETCRGPGSPADPGPGRMLLVRSGQRRGVENGLVLFNLVGIQDADAVVDFVWNIFQRIAVVAVVDKVRSRRRSRVA